jgi:hypothetical protein
VVDIFEKVTGFNNPYPGLVKLVHPPPLSY